jgi:hypothetical protein
MGTGQKQSTRFMDVTPQCRDAIYRVCYNPKSRIKLTRYNHNMPDTAQNLKNSIFTDEILF